METRIAVISIIVEDQKAVEELNKILHEFGEYVIGRMGLPYKEKGVNIICLSVDAPMNDINALTGSLGRIEGITAKATCSNK